MDASSPDVVVVGIDPGTRLCGWGVVARRGGRLVAEGFGVVRARESDPIETRLAAIARGLREVVARFRPAEAAVEDVFHGPDASAAARLGEGRGAVLLTLAEGGVPVSHYANNVVKRAVTGAGRADKERVRTMVRAVLSLASLSGPADASDALALAICHHHARGFASHSIAARAPRGRSTGVSPSHGGPLVRGGVPAGRPTPRVAAAVAAMRAREAAKASARSR